MRGNQPTGWAISSRRGAGARSAPASSPDPPPGGEREGAELPRRDGGLGPGGFVDGLAVEKPAPPVLVVAVPADRLGQPLLDRDLGGPAELGARFGRVEQVAPVEAGAIRDVLLVLAGQAERLGDRRGDLLDVELDAAAQVVRLADAALLEDEVDAPAVVAHLQPLAPVLARAVERHPLALQRADAEVRDDFLRELVRPVVVAGDRDRRRQPERLDEGADGVIAGRLR